MIVRNWCATCMGRPSCRVPDHSHLPVVGELRRMEVQSFRRCVEMWDEADSPVTGARYEAYLQLARATAEAC